MQRPHCVLAVLARSNTGRCRAFARSRPERGLPQAAQRRPPPPAPGPSCAAKGRPETSLVGRSRLLSGGRLLPQGLRSEPPRHITTPRHQTRRASFPQLLPRLPWIGVAKWQGRKQLRAPVGQGCQGPASGRHARKGAGEPLPFSCLTHSDAKPQHPPSIRYTRTARAPVRHFNDQREESWQLCNCSIIKIIKPLPLRLFPRRSLHLKIGLV